jgi:2-polyprenyl-6-methoxyphenol hydroxylase-like FAD-dependent oxidoreductase
MARIVVVGAGVVALGTAMLLAHDDHQVTVLERDPDPPPADPAQAWERWQRPGLNQFRQGHVFLPGFRSVLDAELPEVAKALQAAGGLRFNMIRDVLRTAVSGGWRDGDERYEWLTGRRATVEAVLAAASASCCGRPSRSSPSPGSATRPSRSGRAGVTSRHSARPARRSSRWCLTGKERGGSRWAE